ncbi:MAG: hypothetical protein CMM58_01015 [Rhodospirillaceae bacterium]|nr:hypothetical protein [Rhodospirillaceae bacterium]|tara:strand:+ start:3325 stop:3936 length:612 start_codon:yes stop_codon:yes gene_type:complete
MNNYSPSSQYNRSKSNLENFFDKESQKNEAMDLLLGRDTLDEDIHRKESPFPDLKQRAAKERAKEIVAHLEDLILNPDRIDGRTGTSYKDWAKTARKEISEAIREAESSAAFRELISANRIGGLCLRIGFLLLATVSSFAAFWYGILFIWREHGAVWGVGATLSAVGLSVAFTTAGLLFGGEKREQAKKAAVEKYEDNKRKVS